MDNPADQPPFQHAASPGLGSPPTTFAGATLSESDVRMWAMLCHLAGLCALVLPSFGGALGPLVVWLVKRNHHPAIDANGKEALNFHLSILIYTWVLGVVGALTLVVLVGFVFLGLAILIELLALVFSVVAAVKTSNGASFRYPFTIRFFD